MLCTFHPSLRKEKMFPCNEAAPTLQKLSDHLGLGGHKKQDYLPDPPLPPGASPLLYLVKDCSSVFSCPVQGYGLCVYVDDIKRPVTCDLWRKGYRDHYYSPEGVYCSRGLGK